MAVDDLCIGIVRPSKQTVKRQLEYEENNGACYLYICGVRSMCYFIVLSSSGLIVLFCFVQTQWREDVVIFFCVLLVLFYHMRVVHFLIF